MTNCPNEEDMACYIDGLLSKKEIRQLEEHLLGCDRCKEIVAVSRELESFDNSTDRAPRHYVQFIFDDMAERMDKIYEFIARGLAKE